MKFLELLLLCLGFIYLVTAGQLRNGMKRRCYRDPDPGPCRALIYSYFFNKTSGQCEEFIYGGCEGNKNNFETKRKCEKVCMGSLPRTIS